MSKQTKARAVTLAVIGMATIWAIGKQHLRRLEPAAVNLSSAAKNADDNPEGLFYRMIDAAATGEVDRYLECYAGEVRLRLDQIRSEMTADGFGKYLVERNRTIKGVAVTASQRRSNTQSELRVEYIYPDRNETQRLVLEQKAAGWRIVAMSSAERAETMVPYGTRAD